jgi:hypothetical protein
MIITSYTLREKKPTSDILTWHSMFLTVLGVATLPKKAAPRGVSLQGMTGRAAHEREKGQDTGRGSGSRVENLKP